MKQIATLTYNYTQRRTVRAFISTREIVDVDVSDESAMETTVEVYNNDLEHLQAMLLRGNIQSYKVALERAA